MQTVTEGMKVLVAGRFASQGQRPQRAVVVEIDTSGEWALVALAGTGTKVWRSMDRIDQVG